MLKAFFAVAMVLSLSAATAMAEPAQFRQEMHIASTHMATGSSNEIPSRSTLTATGGEHQQSASGTQATQAADSDPEPESISGGTEP